MCLNCHVVSVATKVKDLAAFGRACQRLGHSLHPGKHHWYDSWVDDSPVPEGLFADRAEYERVVAMSRDDRKAYMNKLLNSSEYAVEIGRQHQIGLIPLGDGSYGLAYDWFGSGTYDFGPLLQAYAVETQRQTAIAHGYDFSEEKLEDGSIRCTMRSWE